MLSTPSQNTSHPLNIRSNLSIYTSYADSGVVQWTDSIFESFAGITPPRYQGQNPSRNRTPDYISMGNRCQRPNTRLLYTGEIIWSAIELFSENRRTFVIYTENYENKFKKIIALQRIIRMKGQEGCCSLLINTNHLSKQQALKSGCHMKLFMSRD